MPTVALEKVKPIIADAIKPMDGMSFGCDPELFVLDDKGKLVTAEGLIAGTKEEPFKVNGGAYQVDGMAAEFNIDPVTTFADFEDKIKSVLSELKKALPKGYKLLPAPYVVFDEDAWAAAPDKAKELGCSPDFNAWTGEMNPIPQCPENPRLRTASGHLHIGWTGGEDITNAQHMMNSYDLVKQLDWYLGGWSLQKDPDPTRRLLYGKAGACRIKDYGVEYRVLSNFWLQSRETRLATWNRMQKAIWNMSKLFMPTKANVEWNKVLIESINNSKRSGSLESAFPYPLRKLDGNF